MVSDLRGTGVPTTQRVSENGTSAPLYVVPLQTAIRTAEARAIAGAGDKQSGAILAYNRLVSALLRANLDCEALEELSHQIENAEIREDA